MTKSFANAQLRRYKKDHPWVRKLPKSLQVTSHRCREYAPIDLGVIDPYDYQAEEEARIVGDGSWAIVYDESREAEWLWKFADNGWVDHYCSLCHYTENTDVHVGINYERCPRCGAHMTGTHGIRFEDDGIYLS